MKNKVKYAVSSMVMLLIGSLTANAYETMEPLTLDKPDLMQEAKRQLAHPHSGEQAELRMLRLPGEVTAGLTAEASTVEKKASAQQTQGKSGAQAVAAAPFVASSPTPGLFSLETPEGVRAYKVKDDLTFAGVPLFVAGIIAKSEKKSFRQDYKQGVSKTRLVTNFHTSIDNYTTLLPMALSTGLNVAGVKGRSKFLRYLATAALSYGIMELIVQPVKTMTSEMRPDGSTANSWPSGHTATAFTSATILHKEYGLTRSPWYSVFGYAVATATGTMRVLNNRHWVSDVLSGAGVGIMSTEVAYAITDLLFKKKGLNMNDRADLVSLIDNPSFFSVSMGLGLGSRNLNFGDDYHFKFRASTVMGVEGAYFFNSYIGVGGRLRVKSTPIGNFTEFVSDGQARLDNVSKTIQATTNFDPLTSSELSIESDHITDFNGALGVYFSYPLSHRFALGSKLLVGSSMMNSLNVKGSAFGSLAYARDFTYDSEWDYLTIDAKNAMTYGTGISLTYAYKSTFSWKVFMDYDFSRHKYTMEYNPNGWVANALGDDTANRMFGSAINTVSRELKKNMNSFVIGGSFVVSF